MAQPNPNDALARAKGVVLSCYKEDDDEVVPLLLLDLRPLYDQVKHDSVLLPGLRDMVFDCGIASVFRTALSTDNVRTRPPLAANVCELVVDLSRSCRDATRRLLDSEIDTCLLQLALKCQNERIVTTALAALAGICEGRSAFYINTIGDKLFEDLLPLLSLPEHRITVARLVRATCECGPKGVTAVARSPQIEAALLEFVEEAEDEAILQPAVRVLRHLCQHDEAYIDKFKDLHVDRHVEYVAGTFRFSSALEDEIDTLLDVMEGLPVPAISGQVTRKPYRTASPRSQERAAQRIQAVYRGYRWRRSLQAVAFAVLRLQSMYRGWKARQQAETWRRHKQLKDEVNEANRLRRIRVETREASKLEMENLPIGEVPAFLAMTRAVAAHRIQKLWRSRVARRLQAEEALRAKELEERNEAARKIQDIWRRKHEREQEPKLPPVRVLDQERVAKLQEVIVNRRHTVRPPPNMAASDRRDHCRKLLAAHYDNRVNSQAAATHRRHLRQQAASMYTKLKKPMALDTIGPEWRPPNRARPLASPDEIAAAHKAAVRDAYLRNPSRWVRYESMEERGSYPGALASPRAASGSHESRFDDTDVSKLDETEASVLVANEDMMR